MNLVLMQQHQQQMALWQQQQMQTLQASQPAPEHNDGDGKKPAAVADPASQHPESLEQRLDILKPNFKNDNVSEGFPSKLHRLLIDLELHHVDGPRIGGFLPDGKSFQILNTYSFEKEILRQYFPRMGSFASFQRYIYYASQPHWRFSFSPNLRPPQTRLQTIEFV